MLALSSDRYCNFDTIFNTLCGFDKDVEFVKSFIPVRFAIFNFTRSEKPIYRGSFGQKLKWRIFYSSTLNKLSVFVQFPTQIQTPSRWGNF